MSIEGLGRSSQSNRFLRFFGSHFDEQQRVLILGVLPSGNDAVVRFLAARACQYVRVHVQHNGGGGGGETYNAMVYVSDTRVDCRTARQQDVTILRPTSADYFVWLIPEFLEDASGTYTRFDGNDGSDQMAFIALGANSRLAIEIRDLLEAMLQQLKGEE